MQKLRQKLRPDPALLSKLRGGATPGAPITGTQVVYRQKPVVPLWLIGLILLLALAAILIYLLWPQKTNVPSLVGASDAFAAEKLLREKRPQAQPARRAPRRPRRRARQRRRADARAPARRSTRSRR